MEIREEGVRTLTGGDFNARTENEGRGVEEVGEMKEGKKGEGFRKTRK